jgi:YesN/AraC family two-component response regulator
MPIEQIVTAVGYSNKSYFYRIFKQRTGMSPLEYRRLV